MGEAREIYTVKEGKASLREYVILATNRHRFEVKNGSRVAYTGESYRQAKALYQELSEKKTEPAEKAIDVMSIRPKRRLLKPRTAYAEAL
jgi:superfamily I DNA and/or RNA helicase